MKLFIRQRPFPASGFSDPLPARSAPAHFERAGKFPFLNPSVNRVGRDVKNAGEVTNGVETRAEEQGHGSIEASQGNYVRSRGSPTGGLLSQNEVGQILADVNFSIWIGDFRNWTLHQIEITCCSTDFFITVSNSSLDTGFTR